MDHPYRLGVRGCPNARVNYRSELAPFGSVRIPRHTSLVAICGFMHAVQIVFAVVWAAFWLYWLVAAFSTKRGQVPWSRYL